MFWRDNRIQHPTLRCFYFIQNLNKMFPSIMYIYLICIYWTENLHTNLIDWNTGYERWGVVCCFHLNIESGCVLSPLINNIIKNIHKISFVRCLSSLNLFYNGTIILKTYNSHFCILQKVEHVIIWRLIDCIVLYFLENK